MNAKPKSKRRAEKHGLPPTVVRLAGRVEGRCITATNRAVAGAMRKRPRHTREQLERGAHPICQRATPKVDFTRAAKQSKTLLMTPAPFPPSQPLASTTPQAAPGRFQLAPRKV